jgi:hypothetical protein
MKQQKMYAMKNNAKNWQGLVTAILVIGALMFFSVGAFAAGPQAVQLGQPAEELTAEWWQWVYSIPQTVNPVLDQNGEDCVMGQRGDVWFLAGAFGGTVTRTCSVPEGKVLFFPVMNLSFFDSPNACGQGPESYTVKEMRAAVAASIDGATDLSVTLDGRPVRNIHRVRSKVFEVSMPGDNLYGFFGIPCAGGVYSPAVDDGYYAHLNPLKPGPHTLHIHAEAVGGVLLDVTYNLTVVPVKLR